MKKTINVKTTVNVQEIDLYFDYELALRRLFLSIGGAPREFGRFALTIAENAARLPPDGDACDGESVVLTILRKIYNLKALYASIKGDSEGFWDFFAKLAEIIRVVAGD